MSKISDHKNYPFPFLQALLFIAQYVVILVVVVIILKPLPIKTTPKWLLIFGLPYLISIPIFYLIRKSNTPSFNFSYSIKNLPLFLSILIIAPLFNIGILLPISNLIPVNEYTESFGSFPDIDVNSVSVIISSCIIAPIAEEYIFRGLILDGLLRKYKVIPSIILSSLVFGIVHLNLWQFAFGSVVGALLGYIYYKTRSLSMVILWHMSNNATYWTLSLIGINYDKTYESTWMYFILIPVTLVLILIYIKFLNKSYSKKNLNWKNG